MLGRTGFNVSTVSFGAWAIGGTWGDVNDEESLRALHAAVDRGVNFFDTADVYGDGRSERLLGRLRRERARDNLIITTKAGRRQSPHVADGYTRANLTAFVERSLANLQVDALDLLQLHCPPPDVLYRPEVFGVLDDLVAAGKLRFYGVSVERVEEALKAIEFPGVQSVQLIYNIVRQRPAELFFPEAKRRQVGVLARLPLSSGLLAGKMTAATQFGADDHRNYNRHGEAFDVGETFSGLDFERGLAFVEKLRPLVPAGTSMASFAIRWILMQDAVTCTIPGAKRESQVEDNVSASDAPPIPADLMARVKALYEAEVKAQVHQRW
jgi:aryl-alcohol dehydrogenase-like predicted oxidoreductase